MGHEFNTIHGNTHDDTRKFKTSTKIMNVTWEHIAPESILTWTFILSLVGTMAYVILIGKIGEKIYAGADDMVESVFPSQNSATGGSEVSTDGVFKSFTRNAAKAVLILVGYKW